MSIANKKTVESYPCRSIEEGPADLLWTQGSNIMTKLLHKKIYLLKTVATFIMLQVEHLTKLLEETAYRDKALIRP
jgi:hypothetical protein